MIKSPKVWKLPNYENGAQSGHTGANQRRRNNREKNTWNEFLVSNSNPGKKIGRHRIHFSTEITFPVSPLKRWPPSFVVAQMVEKVGIDWTFHFPSFPLVLTRTLEHSFMVSLSLDRSLLFIRSVFGWFSLKLILTHSLLLFMLFIQCSHYVLKSCSFSHVL